MPTIPSLNSTRALLFLMLRRAPEQRFFVFARQHVIEVTGTVFVVHVNESDAEVELFEGHVNVRRVSEMCSPTRSYACRDAVLVRAMNPGVRVAVNDSGAATDVQRGSDLLALRAAALVPNRLARANAPTPDAQVARSPTPDSNIVQPQSRRDAEQALAEGRYSDAVAIARARIGREPSSARTSWWVLLADGERGLGHRGAAAEAYERALATSTLAPTQKASIAVSLAQLLVQGSGATDAECALSVLPAKPMPLNPTVRPSALRFAFKFRRCVAFKR